MDDLEYLTAVRLTKILVSFRLTNRNRTEFNESIN